MKPSERIIARFDNEYPERAMMAEVMVLLDELYAQNQSLLAEVKGLKEWKGEVMRALFITNKLAHVFTYQQVHGGMGIEWDSLKPDREWLQQFLSEQG